MKTGSWTREMMLIIRILQESNGQKSDIKAKGKSENPKGFLISFWQTFQLRFEKISLFWVEISPWKHIRNNSNDCVCDYISVLMIYVLDGALIKDYLISKQFFKIHTFCFVKLLSNWRKLAKNQKRHLTKISAYKKNIRAEKIG